MRIGPSAKSHCAEPNGNETYGFFPLWNPPSSLCSEPTSGNQDDRVPAPPPVAEERDARTVLAGKGPLRRAKSGRALACCAPFWRSQDATGGSGGNTIQRQVWFMQTLGAAASVGSAPVKNEKPDISRANKTGQLDVLITCDADTMMPTRCRPDM
jgi:hypothetical protein